MDHIFKPWPENMIPIIEVINIPNMGKEGLIKKIYKNNSDHKKGQDTRYYHLIGGTWESAWQ